MDTTTTRPGTARKMAITLAILYGALGQMMVQLPAQAQAGIYLCVDKEGRRELTDSYRKGCKTLDVPSSIPAPSSSPRQAGAPRAAAPVATPGNFPKVDNYLQKSRDNDRREILNQELYSEEKKLDEMRKEFKNGEPDRVGGEKNYAKYQERVLLMRESISRAEKNIEALRREIANIK